MEFYDSEHNFLGIPEEALMTYQGSKVVLQLLPYEHTSSYQQGSSEGPGAILAASHFVEFYDEELDQETYKTLGIATQTKLDFDDAVDQDAINLIVDNTTHHINNNKFVMTFGAEHTITFGVFKAFHDKNRNVSILQIDAHSDLRQSYEGNPFSHASVMARVNDLNVKISQVGIRAQCIEEAELIKSSNNIQTFYDHQLDGISDLSQQICGHLSDYVYITIDADGIDPSIVPGVGTPEPGGLSYRELLKLLKDICGVKKIVGFDIVECAPIEGQIHSQYVLAKLAYKILGYCTLNPNNF
ncbi:MAG: agmatinase [Bacteroidia bacterium]